MPRKPLEPLSDADLAYLVEHVKERAATLAAALGRPYHTVHKARQRVIRDGWICRVQYVACLQCGQPLCTAVERGPARQLHPACEPARNAALKRVYRRERRPCSLSTPYVAAFRARSPERDRELREAERPRARERFRELPAERRDALLDRAHEADQADQELTAQQANSSGEVWSEDEDRYLLEHHREAARETALRLGRTLYAVRGRRVRLKRRQEAADA